MKRKNFKRGFTLIEVLLALSLLSIVAVCLFSLFMSGIKLSQRFQKQGNTYRDFRWPFDVIEKDLMNVTAYEFRSSYPDLSSLTGEKDALTFLIPTDEGLKAVRYYLEVPSRGRVHKVIIGETYTKNVDIVNKTEKESAVYSLIREEKDFVDYVNDSKHAKVNKKTVADNIKEDGLKLSYASFDVQNKKLSWNDTWHLASLPSAVRIEMDIAAASAPEGKVSLRKDVVIPSSFNN